MELIKELEKRALKAAGELFSFKPEPSQILFSRTKKEFEGDYTLVVFPLVKHSKLSPEKTGEALGEKLAAEPEWISGFNVIKGFLNLTLNKDLITGNLTNDPTQKFQRNGKVRLVEYSSPNTNKPLHLGHVRNNLLGFSIASIMDFAGFDVKKVNLVNDRGIHICKSMLAWKKFGNGETPESTGLKGDHLVGKYYVEFDKQFKREVTELINSGTPKEDAEKKAPIITEAQEMLRSWENGDPETIGLWKKMNQWVYDGFSKTYKSLGVEFDRFYYESETYLLGKKMVEEGLSKGVFFKKPDGSVWIDLTADGLDEKVLLRSDGTSVYMTQDLGTAVERANEYHFSDLVYVVGNEQEYHFKVLKLVLKKLGYSWADHLVHLSYGMVELPEGKMKSREGTVVDADDLIQTMINDAGEATRELGKLEGLSESDARALFEKIGLGALKYFILKVDPKKKMLFNPKESIDLNGHTGPFIQYTYARIQSVLRKEQPAGIPLENLEINEKEREVLLMLGEWVKAVNDSVNEFNPAVIANYVYELAKLFNQFYHDYTILKEPDPQTKELRLQLALRTGETIKTGMNLLGIAVPEKM
jgi:arginyl-tRNA synthetase